MQKIDSSTSKKKLFIQNKDTLEYILN
jgi:hypothetical protein